VPAEPSPPEKKLPGRFSVFLTPSFERDLKRLPARAQEEVIEAITSLETNPFGPPPRVKKLKGKGAGQWRLEAWPHRVRFDVEGANVVLYRVRHRKEVYRD
jgi:mRNA-degrading endonuclease RelE of RelBE toxin-antitoxin system